MSLRPDILFFVMTDRGRELLRSLTKSEKRVVVLVCSGLDNSTIALRLGTTEQVIKNHLRFIFRKARCCNRVQFILLVFREGTVACPCQRGSSIQSSVESLGQQSENHLPDAT